MITLDTTCEFSFAITEYAGYSYWLHTKKIPHRVIVNTAMKPFFFWLDDTLSYSTGDRFRDAALMPSWDKAPHIIERDLGSLEFFLRASESWWTEDRKADFIKSLVKSQSMSDQLQWEDLQFFQQVSVITSKRSYMHNGNKWDPYDQYQTWTPPRYKRYYSSNNPLQSITSASRPVILINNKSTIEWGDRAYNRLPIQFLKTIVRKFGPEFDIWYIRHSDDNINNGFFDPAYRDPYGSAAMEGNETENYDDDFLLNSKLKTIKSIYQLIEESGIDNYNLVQLYMHAKAKYILTVAGGNACLSSYFGEDVVIYSSRYAKSANRHIWLTGTWLDELEQTNKVSGYLTNSKCLEHMQHRWVLDS